MSNRISAYLRLARLEKPVGIWLLFIPCIFGLLLAGARDPWLFAAFGLGSVLMRSAGCVINDIFDRKIDAQVERTKSRPIAAGEISVRQALVFLTLLLSASLAILLTLPIFTILLGFAIIPFVAAYPLMKRITYYPQAFLGLTFNFGVLMAYSATTGTLSLAALTLYSACIFWTIAYDTIYALQDIEDDMRIGVKSTAIAFGAYFKPLIALSYLLFITLFTVALAQAGVLTLPALFSTMVATALFVWQSNSLDPANGAKCLQMFKMNVVVGLVLAAGMAF